MDGGERGAFNRGRRPISARAALLGYCAVVCGAALVMLMIFGIISNDLTIVGMYPLVAVLVLILALPAALAARLALYWLNAESYPAFVLAGAASSLPIPVAILLAPGGRGWEDAMMAAGLLVSGAVGGAVFRTVERCAQGDTDCAADGVPE